MEKNQEKAGIFINGKQQIIEMLQYMQPDEREKLLKLVRVRNAQMADELAEKSITFDYIGNLSDHEIRYVLQYVQAPIMGVAIKNLPQNLQRRILTLGSREYAEQAYKLMMTPLANEKRDIARAQNKVSGIISSLAKRKQIRL